MPGFFSLLIVKHKRSEINRRKTVTQKLSRTELFRKSKWWLKVWYREKAEGVPIHSFVETSERPRQNIQSHKGPLQEVRGVGTCHIFSISPGATSP